MPIDKIFSFTPNGELNQEQTIYNIVRALGQFGKALDELESMIKSMNRDIAYLEGAEPQQLD